MRADAIIRVRVPERLKADWCRHAERSGVPLSDLVRTACGLAVLLGHDRLTAVLSDFASVRRDLNALGADMRRIAEDNPRTTPDELRAVLVRVHMATDAISAALHAGRPR